MPAYKCYKRIALLHLCILVTIGLHAQMNYDYTAGKFMIKGQVMDVEAERPVPLANVMIVNTGKGLTCDNEGKFTMYVSKKDTLRFSSTGYINRSICAGDIDSARFYTLSIELIKDFIRLKEVTIYPYRDLEAFKKAFVDERNPNKTIPGIAPPKYGDHYRAKFYNPISMLYDRIKKRTAANPDFEH